MAVKQNRWGGKQAFDPNTGKFTSNTGAPNKKRLGLKNPKALSKGTLHYKKPIKR